MIENGICAMLIKEKHNIFNKNSENKTVLRYIFGRISIVFAVRNRFSQNIRLSLMLVKPREIATYMLLIFDAPDI